MLTNEGIREQLFLEFDDPYAGLIKTAFTLFKSRAGCLAAAASGALVWLNYEHLIHMYPPLIANWMMYPIICKFYRQIAGWAKSITNGIPPKEQFLYQVGETF